MCKYCKEFIGNPTNLIDGEKFNIPPNEAWKGEPYIYPLTGFIFKTPNDEKAGLFISDHIGLHLIDIEYCPFCGRELVD